MNDKLYTTKYFEPYINDLKTNLYKFNGKKGVYIIKNSITNKIVYVGQSKSNLYKTISRHFQQWNDEQYRVVYPKKGFLVRVILAPIKYIDWLELQLVLKYNPKDNIYSYRKGLGNYDKIEYYKEMVAENPELKLRVGLTNEFFI